MYGKHNRPKSEESVRDEKTAATLTTIKMQISFTHCVYTQLCVRAKSSCFTKLWPCVLMMEVVGEAEDQKERWS